MPPGPFQWPYIGCLPQTFFHSRDILGYLKDQGQRYGGMFSLKMGNYDAVFITDFTIMKEALVNQGDCFNDRPKDMYSDIKFLEYKGVKG